MRRPERELQGRRRDPLAATAGGSSASREDAPVISFRISLAPARVVAALLLAAAGVAPVQAHESWVEPSSFRLESGGRLPVRVCVADGYEGWSLARDPSRIAGFAAIGPAGEAPVVGLEGSDPAGIVRLTEPGDYVIVYHSNRMSLQVPPAQFDAFLREKGLEQVLKVRGLRRAPGGLTRETYARHSKALVRVGGADGRPEDRRIGLALELVAESGAAEEGEPWTFRLLHRGRPLAGALVVATRLGTADGELEARSGDDGRAQFALRTPGVWRVAAVHMHPASRGTGAEWESLWASLTFEIPPPVGVSGPRRIAAAEACRNRLLPPSLRAGT
jgi:uncharacterized GH25 family protein